MRALASWMVLTLVIAAAASAAPVPGNSAGQTLAVVNGELVTAADLQEAFVGKHGGHTVFLGGDAEIRRFLDVVINERLLIQEAYHLGLEADPLVKPEVDAFRDKKSVEYLLRSEIDLKSEPSADEIRQAWELAKDLFLAKEITVDTAAEARSIRESLLRGGDFDRLARNCSISPSRTRGGALTPFTWGSLTEQVERTVMALEPGEISPLFETPEGWMIIQLTDRLVAERPALDSRVSERIAAKLRSRKKETNTERLSADLWNRYTARITAPELAPTPLIRLLRSDPTTVVASWNGGELTAEQAFTEAEIRSWSTLPPGRATEKIRSTLRAAVNTALVSLEAQRRNIADIPEVAEAVDKFEARLMERALYAKHVLSSIKVSEEELRAQYEKEKPRLVLPEKRRVAHLAVATEKEAIDLRRRIDRGEDFAQLVEKHTLDTMTAKAGGDAGWIEKGKVSEMYDPLFRLPQGGVSQPIQSDRAWHLIRITTIEAEHPLSFEEAREKLHETLFEKKKHDAREIWIEKLRKASEIEVDDAAIAAYVKANPFEAPTR